MSKLMLPTPYDLRAAFAKSDSVLAARGYNTEGDVLTQTADGRPLAAIWAEFQASLQIFNEARQPLIDLLTFPVQAPVEDVPQITGDDFEEASEFGVPKGISGGAYFSLGYDFRWYDLAERFTWKFLAEASASQVEAIHAMTLEADNRLLFGKIMRAVFNNVNRTTDIRGTAVAVYPFYNADGTVPPQFKNNTFLSTHNHYLTSGAATITSGDLDEVEEHLVHHGYGHQNGARIVVLMNRAEIATVRTFRVATGASYDFVPAQGAPPFLLPTNTGGIQGSQPASNFQGFTVAGSYGNLLILEEDYIPAGYFFTFATGGLLQATNPIGFRQHAQPGLRGLRLVKGPRPDYPLIDSIYNRGFGTGVRHRGAGVVMQVTASGTYTIPTAYA